MILFNLLLVIVPIFVAVFIVFWLMFNYSDSKRKRRKEVEKYLKELDEADKETDWSDF